MKGNLEGRLAKLEMTAGGRSAKRGLLVVHQYEDDPDEPFRRHVKACERVPSHPLELTVIIKRGCDRPNEDPLLTD